MENRMDKDKRRRGDAHFKLLPCQLERPKQAGRMRITSEIVEITPSHSRQHYALPIETVAEMVVARCMKSNLQAQGITPPRARR